jgi:putative transcriptional regulator
MGEDLLEILRYSIAHPESVRTVARRVDVGKIRKKLHLTQRAFATAYGINLETLKQWEQGKRLPDTTSSAYLTCIAKQPELIRRLVR